MAATRNPDAPRSFTEAEPAHRATRGVGSACSSAGAAVQVAGIGLDVHVTGGWPSAHAGSRDQGADAFDMLPKSGHQGERARGKRGVMTEPVLDAVVLLDDRDRTEENLRLLDLVERATPEELERALGVLSGRAASGGPSDVHLLAVGLASARR